jgi:glycosyltransferase involved in cell wall biosynthesis
VTPDTRKEGGEETDITNLPVHPLPPRGHHPALKYFFLPVLFLWLIVNRDEYEVMLVAGCRVTGIPSVVAAVLLGKPCHLRPAAEGEIAGTPFLHHPLVDRAPTLRPAVELLVRLRNKLFAVGASSFVAISDTIEEELLQAGIPSGKIVRIPNGIPTTEFSPPTPDVRRAFRKEMDLSSENSHAVYVGTLAPRKRVEVLLQAWAKRQPCSCEHFLLLVGPARTEAYRDDLMELTRTLDIQHSVRFVGQVDDVRPFLAAANIFLMASRWEGMSNSLLEAMACGLAPVVTNVSGAEELIEPGENGLLVPNEEEPATKFSSHIDQLLHDTELCAKMGESARQTIE